MKNFKMTWLIAIATATIMWSCSSEAVQPKAENGNQPELAADNSVHPAVDEVCSDQLTFSLVDGMGNLDVQYCGFIPCSGPQEAWGSIVAFNNSENVYFNTDLAFGWYLKTTDTYIGAIENVLLNNGIPTVTENWTKIDVDPVVNSYQVKVPLNGEVGCLALASRFTVVKLDFFSGEDVNSLTELWVQNENWDNPDTPEENTISPFISTWCVGTCGPVVTGGSAGSCEKCESLDTVLFYDCDSIDVTSCKDLSNVVLSYTDGLWQKFDGLSGKTGVFAGTGIHEGKEISHVYIKSGCFKSGEGPGFGRRFNGPCVVE